MDIEMISKYIEPKLLILVPTLWGIGMAIKQSKIENRFIPIILMMLSCFISAIYISSTRTIFDFQSFAACLFASITQGCVIWSFAWYSYEKFLHIK